MCATYIGDNAASVLASESFNRAPVAVVRRIAALDLMSVGEIDFFEACVTWARTRGGYDIEQLRLHLSPVLDLIRFPTMSPEDFARRVVPLNILSDSEACNVYKYFTCPEKPPERFITVKRKQPTSESTTNTVATTDTSSSKSDKSQLIGELHSKIGGMMLSGRSLNVQDILTDYNQSEPSIKDEV
jgi:BTB And C-terminal Kelch